MTNLKYYARRLVVSILLIFVIATFLFFAFRMMPGDYATVLAGGGASEEDLEQIRRDWGLHQPLYVQYYHFLINMVTLDPGMSHVANEPVWEYVRVPLMNSFILVAPAIVTAYVLGSLYGALMGNSPGTFFEKYGIVPPTVIGTTPDFFIGMLLIILFAAWSGLFPTGGIAGQETYRQAGSQLDIYLTRDFAHHYVLPFATIVLKFLYYPALVMRSSVVEVRGQEYTYYQRIAGLSSRKRFKHLIKHASLPVITIFPSSSATAISGLVLIEIVFNWPGIGYLLFSSVLSRDTPTIQFLFILIAIWIILGNWVVDVLYTVIDPRITIED